ncbi:MAG TPA: AEC family transporter [Rectinemataceae bacterium]|nr:AEC family transporter [Rectinemataceae bacterium]
MLRALESVIAVLAMIAIGFGLARRVKPDAQATALLSRLVMSVALPSYMVANLMGGYDRVRLLALLPGLSVPFIVMLLSFGIAVLVARAARVSGARRGVFASLFALSNTIFIGLPVNEILFGTASLPFVLLYYIANTTLFWTIGVYGIARDAAALGGKPAARIVSAEGLRRVLSPPLVAFLASAALILLGVKLPQFLLDLTKTVGGMTTPLSMIFVGITVASVDWRKIRLDLDLALLIGGRFVLSPLLLVLAVRWTDLPQLMKSVFLIQASMPAMTQVPIVARAYGADAEYAGVMTSITTVASLLTIPLFMGLVGLVF